MFINKGDDKYKPMMEVDYSWWWLGVVWGWLVEVGFRFVLFKIRVYLKFFTCKCLVDIIVMTVNN